ncbi:hypothetical protein IGI39_004855 [Enterococcus sp. AZ135]|uniref:CPBP family intramembrane glutamic endopeptidase n=1 Tax=unclassified Enterococcus TaxID=2608891 RepID=UPI003F265B86
MNIHNILSIFRKLVIAILFFAIIKSVSALISLANKYQNIVVYIIVGALIFTLIIFDLFLATKVKILDLKKIRLSFSDLKNCISWLLVILGVKVVGGLILLIEKETTTYNQKGLEDFLMYTPIFIVILFTVISAPIMEEVLFRGFILKVCFADHMLIGIIISGFLFGISHHPTNLGSFFTYAGMGVVLGIYYKRYQRIELSILLHFFNNLIGLIPYIYGYLIK